MPIISKSLKIKENRDSGKGSYKTQRTVFGLFPLQLQGQASEYNDKRFLTLDSLRQDHREYQSEIDQGLQVELGINYNITEQDQ